jgi:replicative DNA helicase
MEKETKEALATYDGEDKVITSFEMALLIAQRRETEICFLSGLPYLDGLIGGFEGGELTAISGFPKQGKTLLAISLTVNFEAQGKHSLWFSYEVMPRQFLRWLGSPLPYFYMPKALKNKDMVWLEERIVEAKLKYDISAVFIDHLHFLFDALRSRDRSLEIGEIIRTLKTVAIENNLCIFLMSHAQKAQGEKEPDITTPRDSSFISGECDNLFLIWRSMKNENEATLKVEANRRMGVMGKKVKLIKVGSFLKEMDIAHEKEPF